MRIFEVFKNQKNLEKGHVALKYRDTVVTYEDLSMYVDKYAAYFQSIGVKKGDKIAISSPNCPEFVYTYLGASKAGAIVVPLNMMLTLQEIGYILKESGTSTIVIHPEVLQRIDRSTLPSLNVKNVVVLDEDFKSSVLKQGEVMDVDVSSADICTYLYTSGTTGNPKGAMLTHDNLISDVIALDEASDLGPSDNFLCVLPMFHSFSWTVNVLLALYLGSTITIKDSFMPKDIYTTLVNEGITVFCGVPSMFAVLVRMAKKGELKTLKLGISGGAPLPLEVHRRFEEIFGYQIIEGYGLSEASPVALLNPLEPDAVRKVGSVGIPLPGVQAKVVDDNDMELPPEEVGELVIKGPIVMAGYHNLPEETAKTLRNGWLHTGDLAKQDEDGYFYIVDRLKDMIIVGGYNVYPREVEEVIYQHPAVQDVAVVGIGDKLKGEDVKAFIVLKEGYELTKHELQKFLQGRLATYKIPKIYEFVPQLPKTPTGKVMKKLLR
ncbi:long-chain-fatty-acid--CoA ligase [Caldanaerobius polysaccharolyticus]|uniref:long-chain-fatty-acid--CoA ligase n=1 Tax=Caldanaerobius polysaccharolyticus TaxID=44256 RepID=UPI00047AB520|nr:long-chain fatty acid--CoA ligase [Caldanaerobius polysaccharolyticus]